MSLRGDAFAADSNSSGAMFSGVPTTTLAARDAQGLRRLDQPEVEHLEHVGNAAARGRG